MTRVPTENMPVRTTPVPPSAAPPGGAASRKAKVKDPAAKGADATAGAPAKSSSAPARRVAGAGALAAELRVAVMRTSRRLRAEAASRDISAGQYSVLAGILNGPLTVGELAEREQIQAPSMTRIVNGLEAAGYVARGDNPRDRRQVLVHVTEAGTAVLQRARSRRTQWLAKRVAALTPEERATLHEAARILQEMSAT